MITHAPTHYVAGMFIEDSGKWIGIESASADELFHFLEHGAQTVDEYEVCLSMLGAQQVYEHWWNKVQIRVN